MVQINTHNGQFDLCDTLVAHGQTSSLYQLTEASQELLQVEKGCEPKQPPDYSKSLEISKTPNMGWGNQSKFDYK